MKILKLNTDDIYALQACVFVAENEGALDEGEFDHLNDLLDGVDDDGEGVVLS